MPGALADHWGGGICHQARGQTRPGRAVQAKRRFAGLWVVPASPKHAMEQLFRAGQAADLDRLLAEAAGTRGVHFTPAILMMT
jgi:hypothetical protein